MSFVKIWVHAVWSTKRRKPLLTNDIRNDIFKHIHQNGLSKNILIDVVNGYIDHVHCLFRLKSDQTIEKVIQLLKGESSYWINKQKLINTRFEWQDEYFAVSISESQVEMVRNYIKKQDKHHQKKSFQKEYKEFIEKYKFKNVNG